MQTLHNIVEQMFKKCQKLSFLGLNIFTYRRVKNRAENRAIFDAIFSVKMGKLRLNGKNSGQKR